LLAHEAIPENTLSNPPPSSRVHTLFQPILSYPAARAFFIGSHSELPRSNDHRAAAAGAKNSLVRRYLASLPIEKRLDAREQIIRQLCDPLLASCMTLLANWMHDYPDDPRPKTLLHELRRNAVLEDRTEYVTMLTSSNLQNLITLYESGGYSHLVSSYEMAERALSLFNGFYFHAAPFNALSLHSAWERCAGSDERCSNELESIRNIGIRSPPGHASPGPP